MDKTLACGARNCRFESCRGHMNLSTPIEQLPRVGPQFQRKLKKLGIKTVGQLLFHFPHRYEDFSKIIPISQVKIGETISIKGKIEKIGNIRTFKKRMVLTQATITDDSGSLKVMWFNQPYLINSLKVGDVLFLAGKMNTKPGSKYLSSPAYEKLSQNINNKTVNMFDIKGPLHIKRPFIFYLLILFLKSAKIATLKFCADFLIS